VACDPESAVVTQEVGVATTGGGQLPVVPPPPLDEDPLEVEPPEELLDVELPEDDPLEVEPPEELLDVELPEDDPLEVEPPEELLDVELPEDDPLEVELPEEPLDVELPEDDPLEVELPPESLDVETPALPPPQAVNKTGMTNASESKCRCFLEPSVTADFILCQTLGNRFVAKRNPNTLVVRIAPRAACTHIGNPILRESAQSCNSRPLPTKGCIRAAKLWTSLRIVAMLNETTPTRTHARQTGSSHSDRSRHRIHASA
jgi:hypothetical protein